MKAFARTAEIDALVDAYTGSLAAAGLSSGYPNDSVARSFFVRIGIPAWQQMPLAEQLTVPKKYGRVVSWLLASQRMQPTAAYVAVGRPWVGVIGRYVHADFYARFSDVAGEVGFDQRAVSLQWAAVMKVAALQGFAPNQLTRELLHHGRDELVTAIKEHCPVASGHMWITAALFGAEATLFHAGTFTTPPSGRGIRPVPTTAKRWSHVTPGLTETFLGYLDQIGVSLRASTVARAETILREFAEFITDTDPAVTKIADLRRVHIEAYKLHLDQRPSITGSVLSKRSLVNHLGALRSCFERPLRRADSRKAATARWWLGPAIAFVPRCRSCRPSPPFARPRPRGYRPPEVSRRRGRDPPCRHRQALTDACRWSPRPSTSRRTGPTRRNSQYLWIKIF